MGLLESFSEFISKPFGIDPTPGFNLGVFENPSSGGISGPSSFTPSSSGGYVQGATTGDATQTNTGGTTGGAYGGGTSASTPTLTAAELAAYNQGIQQLQSEIGNLGGYLESGYSGIDSSYQDALNQLLRSKNVGETDYNQNTLGTKQQYVSAKNSIGSQAGNTLSGLRRLLGSRGAGGSSAYDISAPGAVARQATLQRGDVSQSFGENIRGLDTNWRRFLEDYENQVESAKTQRSNARGELRRTISGNKQDLLKSLAQLVTARDQNVTGSQKYLDQAQDLARKASRYTTAPINYKTSTYQAPSLESYIARPGATPTFQGQQANTDYYSPYYQALLGKDKEQKPFGIG